MTLADWAAWYDSSVQPYVKTSFENDTDSLPRKQLIVRKMMMRFLMKIPLLRKGIRKEQDLNLVFGLIKKKMQRNISVNY